MRLIDADELKKKKKHSYKEFFENVVSVADIDNTPTIEAEPVRHGRWLEGNRGKHDGTLYWYRYCSECLYERNDDNEDKDTPYCPNCGAKMEVNDAVDQC